MDDITEAFGYLPTSDLDQMIASLADGAEALAGNNSEHAVLWARLACRAIDARELRDQNSGHMRNIQSR